MVQVVKYKEQKSGKGHIVAIDHSDRYTIAPPDQRSFPISWTVRPYISSRPLTGNSLGCIDSVCISAFDSCVIARSFGRVCASLLFFRIRNTKNPSKTRASAPTATPTPIPAFAPVDKWEPEDVFELGSWLTLSVGVGKSPCLCLTIIGDAQNDPVSRNVVVDTVHTDMKPPPSTGDGVPVPSTNTAAEILKKLNSPKLRSASSTQFLHSTPSGPNSLQLRIALRT
ncbi:hypothetical protein BKA63DRAFT_493844 [Paraphoma chrysanthemicola]|nr:hypothetical protein BKA63DRAFT_493844 [Paraphoma chrysanthemicola]